MKRKCFALTMFMVLFLSVSAHAHDKPQQIMERSSQKTADAVILGMEGYFHGIIVITDGTNAVTVDAYDNASAASGDKFFPTWEVTTGGNDRIQILDFDPPLDASKGIYKDITIGAGTAKYMVYYRTK